MCWPNKNTIIFDEPISNEDKAICDTKGWNTFYIYDLDLDTLKAVLL